MEELIDIGDKRLTSRDIYILKLILMNERGRYHSTDDAEPAYPIPRRRMDE